MNLASLREKLADMVYPEGKERRNQVERLANIDPITELGNRRAFDLALPRAEEDPNMFLILFDINNLGLVNKKAGHKAGDRVIRYAGCLIESCMRGTKARAFRIGGDEFGVLASVDNDEAYVLRDRIESSFGIWDHGYGFLISLTGTIGGTYESADSVLQERKLLMKEKYNKEHKTCHKKRLTA